MSTKTRRKASVPRSRTVKAARAHVHVETYSDERVAEFLLFNSVDSND